MGTGALSKEFNELVKVRKIKPNLYLIKFRNYKVIVEASLMTRLKSPYGIDRYLLEKFENQGFKIDKKKSQYIRYCFGDYVGATFRPAE